MANAIIIGAVLLPAVIMTLLRANAAVVFLAACLSSVLLQFLGADAIEFASVFSAPGSTSGQTTVQLIVLYAPVVLALLCMIHGLPRNKLFLNIVPGIGTGFILLLLTMPYLSHSTVQMLQSASLWPWIARLQAGVIGVAGLYVLMLLLGWRPMKTPESKKHH
jgi:hypothetical protein